MPIFSQRVTIFAGAGASKAVRPDMFPTTQEFFESLPTNIKRNKIFQIAVQYVQQVQQSPTVDIEQALWALQNLLDFYEGIANPRDVVGYSLQQNLIGQVFQGHNIGHLQNLAPQLASEVKQLINSINQKVYDLYSYEPTEKELKTNWIELISKLQGVGKSLEIFTTNYDVVVEAALNFIDGETSARKWRGINGVVRQTLDLNVWMSDKRRDGLLTKLHGSLDWKKSGEQIYIGDPVFTGDHTKQAIVYPGFKGSSSANFFDVFHAYLAECLSNSDVIIFIGFAFRDDHINNIIRENVDRQCDVYVLNPDKSVKFPGRRVNVTYLHSGFNSSAVKDITGPLLTI